MLSNDENLTSFQNVLVTAIPYLLIVFAIIAATLGYATLAKGALALLGLLYAVTFLYGLGLAAYLPFFSDSKLEKHELA